MSVSINWSALLAHPQWHAEILSRLELLLQEKVNDRTKTSTMNELDDGMRVHCIELNLGRFPPSIELLKLGMDEQQQQQQTQQQQQQQQTKEKERTQQEEHNKNNLQIDEIALRSSDDEEIAAVAAAAVHQRPSSSFSSASSRTSSRASNSNERDRRDSFSSSTSSTRVRSPVSSFALPAVSLRGRFSYSGDAFLTLQIQKQANPLVSKRRLMGRIGRMHLTGGSGGESTIEYPVNVEIWVRLSEFHIDAEIEVEYEPAVAIKMKQQQQCSENDEVVETVRLSAIQHAASQTSATAATTSTSTSTSGATSLPPPLPSTAAVAPSISPSSSSPSLPLMYSLPLPGNHDRASPMLPSSSPSHPSSPSPAPSSQQQQQQQLHPTSHAITSGRSGATSSTTTAAVASSPAYVTILLTSPPLHHLTITSSLDGSPAGEKLRSTLKQQMDDGLAKIIGEKIRIQVPEM